MWMLHRIARAFPSSIQASEKKNVKNTLQDDEKLIASYKRYADGSAKSQVGDAIRKGGPMP